LFDTAITRHAIAALFDRLLSAATTARRSLTDIGQQTSVPLITHQW